LDRAVPADEPDWIRFFTPEKLSAEMMYMASDLGRQHDVCVHPFPGVPGRFWPYAGGGAARP
jgi:hypothetical protein